MRTYHVPVPSLNIVTRDHRPLASEANITILVPMTRAGKPRLREVESLTQSHTASMLGIESSLPHTLPLGHCRPKCCLPLAHPLQGPSMARLELFPGEAKPRIS